MRRTGRLGPPPEGAQAAVAAWARVEALEGARAAEAMAEPMVAAIVAAMEVVGAAHWAALAAAGVVVVVVQAVVVVRAVAASVWSTSPLGARRMASPAHCPRTTARMLPAARSPAQDGLQLAPRPRDHLRP